MKNIIKRNSKTLIFTAMMDTNVFKVGDCIKVVKRDGEWTGFNNRTLKQFRILWNHMHNANLMKLDAQWEY